MEESNLGRQRLQNGQGVDGIKKNAFTIWGKQIKSILKKELQALQRPEIRGDTR
jgi:hypothetical protein